MGRHAEAVVVSVGADDGFEALGFFVDAGGRAPPPGLVNEGAVRGVHEADDAVVDVAGEVGGEMRGAEAFCEFGQGGDGWEVASTSVASMRPAPGAGM